MCHANNIYSICLYSFNYTAPTIILELGYTSAIAQLLTVPIYLLGVISTLVISVLSDRKKSRWPFIVGPYCVSMLAYVGKFTPGDVVCAIYDKALITIPGLLAIPHPKLTGLTYGLLFAIPAGGHPPLLTCLAWVANNLAPSWKRSIGMALLISLGNVGGIIGSNIFLESQRPNYWLGYGFCVGITFCAIISAFGLRFSYARANSKRDKISVDEARARHSPEELIMMGDKSPLYRYVL